MEFALVLPVLLVLLLGILEFGYYFFLNAAAAGAAREGARAAAISRVAEDGEIVAAATFANTTFTDHPASAVAHPAALDGEGLCQPGQAITVAVAYDYDSLTGFFTGSKMKAEGIGEMRCGG
ncbi:TadE/TadG family type IV pilus assembly protein [Tessaracoccus sp. Z1128]